MSSKMSNMPNIPIPLSRFNQDFTHSLDMLHGDIVPVDCFEIVPGDTFNYKLSSLIRMSTPQVPMMSNVEMYLHAFFIPMRLLWEDTEKFYGDPSNHDKVSSILPVDFDSVVIPHYSHTDLGNAADYKRSVVDYMGKPNLKAIYTSATTGGMTFAQWQQYLEDVNLSCLKERAYCCVWNDHFRPSLLVPPILINKTVNLVNSSHIGTGINGSGLKFEFAPFKGFKRYDYFTANTTSPQFGQSVALPLGTTADIIMKTPTLASGETSGLLSAAAADTYPRNLSTDGIRLNYPSNPGVASGTAQLFADLQNAIAATVNQLRYAFQVQMYLERSNFGDKFHEILNAHYGVSNPDLRLQRSQRLGSHKFYINISQVLSTAETVNSGNTTYLGQPGAVSVTGDSCNLFSAHFEEPGYVLVVATTKVERLYESGYLREDIKKNRFEFYSPEFNNLGDQMTKQIEVQTLDNLGNVVSPTSGFGFQEHWAEYRYRRNLVSGSLRKSQGLDIWTAAESFDGVDPSSVGPTYSFLYENREPIYKCLVSGSAGPDYVCDFRADITATREMSLHSIPGLIDHFGAL